MVSSVPYFCGISATVFVAVSLAMAAIRWFHLCRPYDRNPRYYYPGRPFVVSVMLGALALIPYICAPESEDAWFLARVFFFPVTLYDFTILLYAYFGSVMQWKKWRWPMIVIGFPVLVALVASFVLALVPGEQTSAPFVWGLYALGLMITVVCFAAMRIVLRWAKQFDEDDYSNPADFPVIFARRWVVMIVVNTALCWTVAITASRMLLAFQMLLFSVSLVLFILTALHPRRNRPVGEEEEAEAVPAKPVKKAASAKILAVIDTVVVKQEAYLDPHLTIQDVADRSGYSRSHIAGLFKQEFGGFFTYVNRLRLQHVESYLQEYPAASLQEALEASGFNSRQAYYAVKARLGE